MATDSLIAVLACPACATGQGQAGSGGWLLAGALVLLPLAVGIGAGIWIRRTMASHEGENSPGEGDSEA